LQALTASDEPFALSDVVLSGFLCIVTNPRIFEPPTPMETALAFCQRLVDWPRASLITSGRRYWELFTGLCRDITEPLVTDAYIAALVIEHGCELVTTDGDFARFPGLRWRHPLAAGQHPS
jgi:toxin-antitoxin system PIN domain toxin